MKRPSVIALALLVGSCLVNAENPPPMNAERDFTLKVLPLLKAKCFACHGDDPEKIKGELNMLSREGLLRAWRSAFRKPPPTA